MLSEFLRETSEKMVDWMRKICQDSGAFTTLSLLDSFFLLPTSSTPSEASPAGRAEPIDTLQPLLIFLGDLSEWLIPLTL